MKRIGFIYEKIYDLENIKKAIWKASEQKRTRPSVKKILDNIDSYALKVQKMLVNKEYVSSPYFITEIHDNCAGKKRTIYKPAFYPDQIIHWALMLQIQPILMRGMYAWNCGSVPGRGVHYKTRVQIEQALKELELTLKDNWQVFKFESRGLDFLGFRFFRNHTTMRKRNALKVRRKAMRIYKKNRITFHDAASFISYLGWVKHSDSLKFKMKYIEPYVNINKLKEVIRRESRIHSQAAAG